MIPGLTGAASVTGRADVLVFTLKKEAVVKERYVTLGDVIEPDVDLRALGQDLRALRIGRAPRSGYPATFTRTAIHAGIERVHPGMFAGVHWEGAEAVKVRTLARRLKARRYVDDARIHLDAWLGARYSEFEIRPKGELGDLLLPEGAITIKPSIAETTALRRRMCVWVDVEVDGEHYQSVPVWFEVKVFAPVLTAERVLPVGSVLDADMFRVQHLDIARVTGRPLAMHAAGEKKRLTKTLEKGGVLTEEVVEPLPPVWRGQRVAVRARVGRVVLQTRAIADEDGFLGETIRVRKTDSGETYRVRVVGEGMVLAEGE